MRGSSCWIFFSFISRLELWLGKSTKGFPTSESVASRYGLMLENHIYRRLTYLPQFRGRKPGRFGEDPRQAVLSSQDFPRWLRIGWQGYVCSTTWRRQLHWSGSYYGRAGHEYGVESLEWWHGLNDSSRQPAPLHQWWNGTSRRWVSANVDVMYLIWCVYIVS